MIKILQTDAAARPSRWIVCFKLTTGSRWLDLLVCGRRKHICAFGYVEPFDAWVFYNVGLRYQDIVIARGGHARNMMFSCMKDADVLGFEARPGKAAPSFGGWCVPAIKRLIGLNSGALRPDALYRDCLAHGAEIIDDSRSAAAGPRLGSAEATG